VWQAVYWEWLHEGEGTGSVLPRQRDRQEHRKRASAHGLKQQYLYIGDKQYSASSDALLAIDESQNFFLQEINPGNSVKGIIVFDIPKGGQPDRLELHDSPFSGGVTVTL
jgi:Domain of unknown function (DUF4352)